jgi:hypothetical protein
MASTWRTYARGCKQLPPTGTRPLFDRDLCIAMAFVLAPSRSKVLDVDNLAKTMCDGLRGTVYMVDTQIQHLDLLKVRIGVIPDELTAGSGSASRDATGSPGRLTRWLWAAMIGKSRAACQRSHHADSSAGNVL